MFLGVYLSVVVIEYVYASIKIMFAVIYTCLKGVFKVVCYAEEDREEILFSV